MLDINKKLSYDNTNKKSTGRRFRRIKGRN